MNEPKPQTLKNHTRFEPMFHFFIVPVLLINVINCIVHVVRWPALHTAWMLVVAVALFMLAGIARSYALRVQDRVIRLEERMRLGALAGEPLRSRIAELDEQQLVALRFASDAEAPSLAERALTEHLTPKQIKQSIVNWRPDYWRV